MSTALVKSLDSSRAFARTCYDDAMQLKAAGQLGSVMVPSFGGGPAFLTGYRDQVQITENYGTFRNWLYSAINALALEAAGQPISLARLATEDDKQEVPKRSRPGRIKEFQISKMPKSLRSKAASQEYETLLDHPILAAIERPNEMQGKWELLYSFVANLNLTGWAYLLFDTDKDGKPRLYSIPTTWVRPDHKDGPYSKFYIVKPGDPLGQANKPLTRDNVAFAYLPDPSNPLGALAPATSQMPAIRIDDYIQSSQEQHFQNGIFPSVIVTIGKDPHPDVPGGIRPRLTDVQRRQIFAAIGKAMGGVANYGTPAIVDGLIESITRFSASEPEMGWSRSEDKVRTRILSAYGVHPYILGEPVGVGGYAQVANIEKRFYKRVNTFLDLFSNLLTGIVRGISGDEELLAWVEECQVVDPSLRQAALMGMRTSGDISQNELRAEFGFPPDEDHNEAVISGAVGPQIAQALALMAQGGTSADQMEGYLTGLGLPDDLAQRIAGAGSEKQAVQQATEQLQEAVKALKEPIDIGSIIEKFNPNHDESGRFAEGGGAGGGSSDTGQSDSGSGGDYESYNTRIEGTQKEADHEVSRYTKTAAKAKKLLEVAEAKQTISRGVASKLKSQIDDVDAKRAALESRLAASRERIAALKSQLKKSVDRDLSDALDTYEGLVEELQVLNDVLDGIIQQIENA